MKTKHTNIIFIPFKNKKETSTHIIGLLWWQSIFILTRSQIAIRDGEVTQKACHYETSDI